ncbi:MAG TPA: ankyrin repeat domain-containing protein [Planctomycetota bacterium]|nr:ankyrin repeat domain-containing protein [Planctomycetota bacterium]
MPRRRFTVPISILLLLGFTLVGTYVVRKRILEDHMATALEMNDREGISSLLDAWPCPLNARQRWPEETRDASWLAGATPLDWAVWRADEQLVSKCLVRGADVNARWINGWAPLHVAAMFSRLEIAETLIEHGADVNARDAAGQTPLGTALHEARDDFIQLLRNHGATE